MSGTLDIRSVLPDPSKVGKDGKPVAIITGITGQDGSYMTELLLAKGYTVIGIVRPGSNPQPPRLAHLDNEKDDSLQLYYGDIIDPGFLHSLVKATNPDEVYHFAAQSNVPVSFNNPGYTMDVNAKGTLHVLQAIKDHLPVKSVKFYNACTSELFGESEHEAHDENSVFHPKSPYGFSKLSAYWQTKLYRDGYKMFAVNGILFNHESPRRGELFVTQKVAQSVAQIHGGDKDHVLQLGNINSYRDWGHAKDYMEGIYAMMHAEAPDDFVLSTNETHSVREFVELAFRNAGIKMHWEGEGIHTIGVEDKTGRTLVKIDPSLCRVLDINRLLGDCSKARTVLGFQHTTSFEALVSEMVESAIIEYAKKAISRQVTVLTTGMWASRLI